MKKVLLVLLVLVICASVAFAATDKKAEGKVLRMLTWTGYAPQSQIDEFERLYGIKVEATPSSNEALESNEAAEVEPADSPVLTQGKAGPHKLQGIGANFVPEILDTNLYDQVVTVTTDEAYDAAKKLVRAEGLLTGISSGAALSAAIRIASAPESAGKTVVVLLPDTGERYLSAGLFD